MNDKENLTRGEMVEMAVRCGVISRDFDYAVPLEWERSLDRIHTIRLRNHGAIWYYGSMHAGEEQNKIWGRPIFLDDLYAATRMTGKIHEVEIEIDGISHTYIVEAPTRHDALEEVWKKTAGCTNVEVLFDKDWRK